MSPRRAGVVGGVPSGGFPVRFANTAAGGGGGASVTVASITPDSGIAGSEVVIAGTNFADGQAVLLGGVALTSIVVDSATQITANVPASGLSGGTLYDLSVAGVTLADAFTWYSGALFESDWAGGTLADGVWTVDNSSNRLAVVDSTGFGFPAGMAKVLRIEMASSGADDLRTTGIGSAPAVGQSRYFRLYLRVAVADGEGNYTSITPNHPFEPATGNDAYTWNWNLGSKADGTFPITLNFLETPYPSRYHTDNPVADLSKSTTYRLEWVVTKTSDSGGAGAATGTACGAYTGQARVYDDADALVYDTGDFYNQSAAALTGQTLRLVDSALTKLLIGNNGASTWTGLAAGQYIYVGGVMVRDDTWCGAY